MVVHVIVTEVDVTVEVTLDISAAFIVKVESALHATLDEFVVEADLTL